MASSDGRVVNDTNDHSPAVHIAAWLGVVVSVLAIFARVGTKWIVQRKVEWDDGAIVAAFVGLYCATTSSKNRRSRADWFLTTNTTRSQPLHRPSLYHLRHLAELGNTCKT